MGDYAHGSKRQVFERIQKKACLVFVFFGNVLTIQIWGIIASRQKTNRQSSNKLHYIRPDALIDDIASTETKYFGTFFLEFSFWDFLS
jgi:hypothetical protein